MEEFATAVVPSDAKKRKRNPSSWKTNVAKVNRYSPASLPTYPTCGHHTKSFRCSTLKMSDIKDFHNAFYISKCKLIQNAFILKYCTVQSCKRRRPKNDSHAAKTTHTKCFVRSILKNKNIPVCQATFRKILGITKHRINSIMQSFAASGHIPLETRGGDRKSLQFRDKQAAVVEFISKLKCIESHYCRSKTARHYLSSDLNIAKLFRMYNTSSTIQELQVKESYFRETFNTKFNLSFKSPRTDVCSTCLEYSERIKRTTDEEIKKNLLTEERIHKVRAKAFFQLLREKRNDLITLSFDCQKNLVLPKIPDQSVYYSRQLYLYNFTIVQGTSKSKLNMNNVFSYYWTENEHKKGSNEICSAVYHRLNQIDFGRDINVVRLVADGCSGQNKNSIMVGMCCKWLYEDAPKTITSLELVFPVTGHSFLPADRVFAQIEKKIRKIEVLTQPTDYIKLLNESATVIHLGNECEVWDWKVAVQNSLKGTGSWHFGFKQSKRFFLTRSRTGNILIRGELHYNNNLNSAKSVMKKGKTPRMIKPSIITKCQHVVNYLKLRDVNSLLKKHFGDEWRTLEELSFYNNVITETGSDDNNDETLLDDNEMCEFSDEIPTILI